MKQSVTLNASMAKLFSKSLLLVAIILVSVSVFAQQSTELVFQNPTLIAGIAGKDGAQYRFPNVTTGVDALVKIRRRSSSSVVLDNIDVSNLGWNKAFQPQLGIAGNVPANQNWWMEFEMQFVQSGTTKKQQIHDFAATSLDVDGDGLTIQEYTQMNGVQSVKYCPATYLKNGTLMPLSADDNGAYNGTEKSVMIQGPIQNFKDIDTLGTQVMATYSFKNMDMISFYIGAKSGCYISNAGERLNSIWFKSFDLTILSTLPVRLTGFNAVYDKQNVSLSWTTASEENFSRYILERSTDGKSFAEIATVLANGNTNLTSNYQYKDNNVSSNTGILYYRLRMVEKTGESNYSDVRVIRLAKDADNIKLTAYPNPVSDQLRVTLPDAWQGKQLMLELYNSNGVRIQGLQINSASQTETLKLGNIARGFYIVKASCNNQVAQQPVIKN